jgi:hypothetical protein
MCEDSSSYDDGYEDGENEGYDRGYDNGYEEALGSGKMYGADECLSPQDVSSLMENHPWKLLPRCPFDAALILQEGNELKCQKCRRVFNLVATTKE